ncbi:Kinesin-like protein kin-7o [Thalictrum thalictroides]|uniref:Kinesin-like protein kin-7o n=1 Tax=Thalictrum thalictroides TaxID=46969 RepID=A0A7J6UXT6_THATH|nr:Kinesin-like protein kin-7o [Thalictrum thalictroides]
MERIFVTVRPRPLSSEDAKSSPWRISENSISIANQTSRFEFDRIFKEDCTTVEVYEARTKDIVSAAVCGFNGTVFAYGQTNSGKTYTMRGSEVEPGVIRLAVRDLFDTILEDVDREFLLRMSYMEIYNEDINDLLAPEHRKLQIHENLERGIFVAGLKEEIVATPEQVIDLMEFGESHRHIGETNMNVYSSRSHTIFRMIIESRLRTEDDNIGNSCDAVRVSVLNLVDLAGSERAAKTGAEGMRLKEGSHINKSLMTLGTVIKKLSEGAESNGGHVPYRDSKLTRILQPSLGGNANTAIICNITLAQIHADETKSSLQFASRALRVTNCARVNEILTDAALLKRQKKEIEELRARLQGSHAEHFEEEILNLRNTLLQSELERERIALELQEEKKAQALREKRLQEQAKKIENLSSLVLNSSADESRFTQKKDKRRETWCPTVISRDTRREVSSTTQWEASLEEPVRPERNMGLPRPFEELVHETESVVFENPQNNYSPGKHSSENVLEECLLPDAQSLLNVTNRRKTQVKKKNSFANESQGMQTEYEDLLVEYETQRITKDIEIQCLTRKLAGVEYRSDMRENGLPAHQLNECTSHGDRNLIPRESESIIVIKQLQEQVKMLEMEKSSIQQNLDDVIELATKQKTLAGENYTKIYNELVTAREEAGVARDNFSVQASLEVIEENNVNSETKLLMGIQETVFEVECSRNEIESISSSLDELYESFAILSDTFLELKTFSRQSTGELKSIMCNHEKIHKFMEKKIAELEIDKSTMLSQSINLHEQIQELQLNLQESERVLMERCQQQDLEKVEYLSRIENLETEILSVSSSSLAKEKETVRKELEKTKMKLKESDFKLKNAIQDKTKLEGEKAQAEREIKKLHGQMSLLERDICRRDSLAGRVRDSFADKRRESKALDANKARDYAVQNEQIMQGEYRKLEVLAFEMETTIASLEEQLTAANEEKEEAFQQSKLLASELNDVSNRLTMTSSELKMFQEDVLSIRLLFAESESSRQKLESSISLLQEEKDQLAMQLTDSLLELEEEKAIWSMKEKASIESIAEKTKLSSAELGLLSKELSEVMLGLESLKEECKALRERLKLSEEKAECERKCSQEKTSEIDQLRCDLKSSEFEREIFQNVRLELESCKEECKVLSEKLILSQENAECDRKCSQEKSSEIDLLRNDLKLYKSEIEDKKNDRMKNNNEIAKLRMRVRTLQAKLDASRGRYSEAINEMCLMDRKYKKASTKLKEQMKERLASDGAEIFRLKRCLALAERDRD